MFRSIRLSKLFRFLKMAFGCAVQLFCWICLLFASILFIGFVLTFWEAVATDSNFCSRSQLLIGVECAQNTRQLEDSLLKINKTVRFLRPPAEYQDVVELCEKTNKCLKRITCEDGHEFVREVESGFPACEFYQFYTGEMKECAETLLTKMGNYTCLKTLFKAKHNFKFNRCEQWRDIQPCVHDAIASECDVDGNATTLAYRFGEVGRDFFRAMNCVSNYPSMDSEEDDFEVVGLLKK